MCKRGVYMKRIIPLLLFLLSISFVSALNVDVSPLEIDRATTTSINVISCAGLSALEIRNPDGVLVQVGQGNDEWSLEYNPASNGADGTYEITASCVDGTDITQAFCVNSPGCIPGVASDDGGDDGGNDQQRGGSGGFQCNDIWSCSTWSQCNATLQQSQTCLDLGRCKKGTRLEVQSCPVCEETWICDEWSACVGGQQSRVCTDFNSCGNLANKPVERRSCVAEQAVAPLQQSFDEFAPLPPSPERTPQPSVWDRYGTYIAGIPVLLILIGVAIFFLLRYRKQQEDKGTPLTSSGLESWVDKQRAKGFSDAQIKKKASQSGWSKKDVDAAFGDDIFKL